MTNIRRLPDQELIRRGKRDAEGISPGRLFYTDAEVAVTAELQRRGLMDGDGQISSRRKKRRRK